MKGVRVGTLVVLFWTAANLPPELDPVMGQVPDSLRVPADTVQEAVPVQPEESRRISPRGAFIRSSLVPGWGHTAVGAFVRGAFYFSAEAASTFMVYKTQTRIARTKERLAVREAVLTARLEAQGITDPAEVEAELAQDEVVEDLRGLEASRKEQREDWIALGVFLMLIGGADAYVSAHLADFPVPVVVEATPAGVLEVGISLPVSF